MALRIRTTSLSSYNGEAPQSAKSEAPKYELMSALATLLEAGKYSDLTIICGARRFQVHRAIICSRSGFFDGACSNPFREAETGIIDLSEDDEEAVEHMIHYFYHLDYLMRPRTHSRRTSRGASPPSSQPTSPTLRRPRRKLNLALVEDPLLAQAAAANSYNSYNSYAPPAASNPLTPPAEEEDDFNFGKMPPDSAIEMLDSWGLESFENAELADQEPDLSQPHLIVHAKVYAIAEKYGIVGLKTLARAKFSSQLSVHYNGHELPDALAEVYDGTVDSDRGLRDLVVQVFRAHPEIARRRDVEGVVRETPGLAWELFRLAWGMPV
ncbi:hypothetical protein K402DRAFT_19785 [Aulographum hederae CBS 113979]|uniref:BTB domain-containing protein n=1 Tax=Aulographum hederae CBS 113979 TaxID=1176131 RepID=A0A6G1H6D4_9PEZI|nr:hypothetical protein K402DRAFT_19785 [Aulographum hederae CBS 113979]